MKLETTLKLGIGGVLVAACGLGAWALWPDEPGSHASTAERARHEDGDEEVSAKDEVFYASLHSTKKSAEHVEAGDANEPEEAEGSLLAETDAASLGASPWMEGQYDHAYVYTGTALSKEERNAKKGIYTEATLRAREDELIAANPEMKAGIEAERVARQAELERYHKSGGLSVEEEAIQKGVQLED